MSTIEKLATIYSDCVKAFEDRRAGGPGFEVRETFGGKGATSPEDTMLAKGDNLEFMRYLLDEIHDTFSLFKFALTG